MGIKYSEQSRIFRDFRSIPYSDYYYLIRFYEQYHKDIHKLPFDEALIMSYYYANALFETQEYDTLIETSNEILQQVMLHNVRYIDGEDVYMNVLHKKTIAHLRLGEIETATKFATQLVRMDSDNYLYEMLLRQCFTSVRPAWIRPTLTLSTIATLMCAIATVICASLHQYLPAEAVLMPYSLLVLAAVGLAGTAWGYYRYVMRPTLLVLAKAKGDKIKNKIN